MPTNSKAAKMSTKNWLVIVVVLLFLSGNPCSAFADFLSKFHPYIFVQEEYSDNIFLTSTNETDDFITTISPGLRFSTLPIRPTTPAPIEQVPAPYRYGIAGSTPLPPTEGVPTAAAPSGLDIDGRVGFVFYAKETENNYTSAEGRLNAWHALTERLNFQIRDYLIRSQEPREQVLTAGAVPGQSPVGTIRGERPIYFRNVFEPSIAYQFGREDRLALNYRNNIYENKSPLYEDSQENFINPQLTYWFNVRNGVFLEYGLTLGEFERSPDLVGHLGRFRYTYRFNPRTSIFGEYISLYRDFESPGTDYDIQNPSIGIMHAFTPTLSGILQVGYFWQNPERGPSENGLSYNAGLTQLTMTTVYYLNLQGGYTEDFFTAENLGFTKYHRVIGGINHRILNEVTAGLSGTLERVIYPTDRKDWIWGVRGNVSYNIFRWLILSFDVYHIENDSNFADVEYKENRGILRLRATL